MDPRDRADAVLARAEARRDGVVTPINQTSPMDASSTCRLRISVVQEAEQDGEDSETQSIPAPYGQECTEPLARPRADSSTTEPLVPATRPEQSTATDQVQAGAEREQPQETELDGLIPTVSQQQRKQRSVAERLSGLD